MNERLKPKDLGGELINSLNGSNCIGLDYESVQPDLTAIRTYFTRWLSRTNSYDLTRTNSYDFC